MSDEKRSDGIESGKALIMRQLEEHIESAFFSEVKSHRMFFVTRRTILKLEWIVSESVFRLVQSVTQHSIKCFAWSSVSFMLERCLSY